MASKGFTDHLIGFVDKAFEVLEEATIRVLDKLDEPEESPAEEAFEPTAGYLPCIGDTVAIKPESEVLVGLVQEVKRELRTTQVVAMDGAEHAFSWWVPWGSVKLIDSAYNPNPAQPMSGPLEAYYEARLRRLEEEAQRVSAQHRHFVKKIAVALGDRSLTEQEALNELRGQIATLGIVKRRLGVKDNLVAIRTVEDLMRQQ